MTAGVDARCHQQDFHLRERDGRVRISRMGWVDRMDPRALFWAPVQGWSIGSSSEAARALTSLVAFASCRPWRIPSPPSLESSS